MTIRPEELTSNNVCDRLAKTYACDFHTSYTQYLKFILIVNAAKPHSVCLDVGIANGLFSIPLAPNVCKIHGIDISQEMLNECKNNIEKAGITNIECHNMSATELGFDNSMFDLAYSFSTLLLVPSPKNAYREIARVLKPGGIAVLDITGTYNLSRIYWSKYYRKHGHFGLNHYSYGDIKSIFESLGLEVIGVHASGLLDQWKYIPLLNRMTILDTIFHKSATDPDIDYKASQLFQQIANRWYFILRKK